MNYTELAMRTAKYLPTPSLDFTHAALGLVDESYELELSTSEDNALEELGDLLWFLALAGRTLKVDPFAIQSGMHESQCSSGGIATMISWLREHSSLVAGVAKKWLISGREPPEGIETRLARMVDLVATIGEQHGWTLEHIQDANIRKLAARYPAGFSDWMANHRDYKAERDALRGE